MLALTRARSTESKVRLLYLGNDLELIAAVGQVLTEPDYRLVTCSDFGSATLLLKSEIPYHLLLIDLEWRDSEGLKLARLAHSLLDRKHMRIILVVATKSNNELRALARRVVGVTDWVMKTPDMGAVSEAIRQLISHLNLLERQNWQ